MLRFATQEDFLPRVQGTGQSMSVDIQRIKEQVLKHTDQLERIRAEVRKVLVGQDVMLSRLLIALLMVVMSCSKGCQG